VEPQLDIFTEHQGTHCLLGALAEGLRTLRRIDPRNADTEQLFLGG
jgi:hypothetical protein